MSVAGMLAVVKTRRASNVTLGIITLSYPIERGFWKFMPSVAIRDIQVSSRTAFHLSQVYLLLLNPTLEGNWSVRVLFSNDMCTLYGIVS
mmetsp:Transcript_24999/g.24742  ORF Transcript_24999/g.24742 Transcript_24999/m.24742 type:complete len:90 (-) Transcript_24999:4-273(-)